MSIAAELHDKMPLIYSEDMLTSNVFTALRYLPADTGIIGFLRTVEGLGDLIEAPDADSSCTIYFWLFDGRREPDVLLEMTIRAACTTSWSRPSTALAPSDSDDEMGEDGGNIKAIGNHLAAEFQDLQQGSYRVPVAGSPWHELRLASASRDRSLLYLTAHQTPPQ